MKNNKQSDKNKNKKSPTKSQMAFVKEKIRENVQQKSKEVKSSDSGEVQNKAYVIPPSPIIIELKNITDEKLFDVEVFNYDYREQKKIEYSCPESYARLLRSLAAENESNKIVINKIRVISKCDYEKYQKRQMLSDMRFIHSNLNGRSASDPIVPINYITPHQQPQNIADIIYPFSFWNRLQIKFDFLMPETHIKIYLFPNKHF